MNRSVADRFARLLRFGPLGAGILLGLFLLGLRWDFIGRFGTDLPVWDQWDAEGTHLLAPLKEGRPVLPELFQPHNEHRVIVTKLVNLTLTVLNGAWDQRLEAVCNALFPAALAALIFLHSRRFCPAFAPPFVWLLLAAAWGSPLSWQNMISGFHSQQIFLLGFSYGAIACLATARPWTTAWWVGAVSAVLALGSMGSGFLAAFIVLGLLGWRLWRREVAWPEARPALAVAAAAFLIGAATRVSVDYHEVLKAHTVHDFGMTLALSLQWPAPAWLWLAAIVWAPWAWLVVVVLRRPRNAESPDDGLVLLGLGAWVLVQLFATAYVRGDGGLPPPTRYFDTLIMGVVVNALALGWLATRLAPHRARSLMLATLAIGWLAVVAGGTLPHVRQSRDEMVQAASYEVTAANNTRNFLLTNDARHIQTPLVPYPSPETFYYHVSRPSLRALMPLGVRPPLAVLAATVQGFTAEKLTGQLDTITAALPAGTPPLRYEPFWSSWNATGATNTGEWTSTPVQTKAGWIELRVTGRGRPPEVAVEIRDARLGTVLAVVPPPAAAGVWQKTYVRNPSHGFVIAAVDRSATGWIAFSAPVETHWLSYYAILLTRVGWPLAAGAAGGALVLAGLALLPVIFPRLAPRAENEKC